LRFLRRIIMEASRLQEFIQQLQRERRALLRELANNKQALSLSLRPGREELEEQPNVSALLSCSKASTNRLREIDASLARIEP
jgi:cell division inhibitor SulA